MYAIKSLAEHMNKPILCLTKIPGWPLLNQYPLISTQQLIWNRSSIGPSSPSYVQAQLELKISTFGSGGLNFKWWKSKHQISLTLSVRGSSKTWSILIFYKNLHWLSTTNIKSFTVQISSLSRHSEMCSIEQVCNFAIHPGNSESRRGKFHGFYIF